MPVEIMAKRGDRTLVYGPMKPVGLEVGKWRPYAVVQLRRDNAEGTLYNMVGFQTNLKFDEQKRVFRMIPGLENAEFVRYGVMHRNTFLKSPGILDWDYMLKGSDRVYFAGLTKKGIKRGGWRFLTEGEVNILKMGAYR